MDASFWFGKWERNEIGFHQPAPNPMLVNNFEALSLNKGDRVFIPLCGKTHDIGWLLSKGFRVAGVELSQVAIEQLFTSLSVTPEISKLDTLLHYSAPNIDIFVGDVFALSGEILGPVDAIYDRAALVALPKEMRMQYTPLLTNITNTASQLVVIYAYDQDVVPGPPFSITTDELTQHYKTIYDLKLLSSEAAPNGMKGLCPATESVWLLTKK
ncbi:MAG: thiopurine S-methyltransferase [Rhodothermales bacterium]